LAARANKQIGSQDVMLPVIAMAAALSPFPASCEINHLTQNGNLPCTAGSGSNIALTLAPSSLSLSSAAAHPHRYRHHHAHLQAVAIVSFSSRCIFILFIPSLK